MTKKKIILILLINIFLTFNVYSFENKILVKIDNEIITTIDIFKETQYLSAINKNIQKLSKDKIFDIAKDSLIRTKIKNKEIRRFYENVNPDEKIINNIIKNNAAKLGFKTLSEFKKHLSKFDIDTKMVRERLINEILWNKLVNERYFNKVVVDEEKIIEEINSEKKIIKSFLLSEIVFNLQTGEVLENKFKNIEKEIIESGFENAALINSISDTSSSGGKLGWIKETSLNKKIKSLLNNLKANEYTQPIAISGGYLILKVEKIIEKEEQIDKKKELEKRINIETNNQLSRFSLIYFNKIRKNTKIYEL